MALWLGAWLWTQEPIAYLQLEVSKVLAATDMGEERRAGEPRPTKKKIRGFFAESLRKIMH